MEARQKVAALLFGLIPGMALGIYMLGAPGEAHACGGDQCTYNSNCYSAGACVSTGCPNGQICVGPDFSSGCGC
jgi:hypothetical protein